MKFTEADRKRYITTLSNWFASLQPIKEEYQLLYNALLAAITKQATESVGELRWFDTGELIPAFLQDYYLIGEGMPMGQAKVGLEWCVYIIEEGQKLVAGILQGYATIPPLQPAPVTNEQTLESQFEHTSKYVKVMNLLVQKEWCQAGTYLWIDESVGAKGTVIALIKYLHAQGFYRNNEKLSNAKIVSIAKNTFGVAISIDTAKKTKVPSGNTHNLSFIKPASTY